MQQAKDRSRYERQRLAATRAAAAEFSEKGFHGASTSAIAQRLGIKQGSLYYYFKSKEAALFEVCMFAMQDYLRRMEEVAVSDQPFEDKLLRVITSHLSSYREKNEAMKVYNSERLYLSASERKDLKRVGSRYRQLLESVFEQGVQQGALRQSVDCHFTALAVIGLCNAWGELIVRDAELDVTTAVQRCVDLLLYGISRKQS